MRSASYKKEMVEASNIKRLITASVVLLFIVGLSIDMAHSADYPRTMGYQISGTGNKGYKDPAYQADLCKLDAVTLGFYKGIFGKTAQGYTDMATVVNALKTCNPDILVGNYTILNEAADKAGYAKDDQRAALTNNDWWLLNASGSKVQWTDRFGAWETNLTTWTTPDANGDRWPQWYAKWINQEFFTRAPFDYVFYDNTKERPLAGTPPADWDKDGVDETRNDADIVAAHKEGVLAELATMQALQPALLHIPNIGDTFQLTTDYDQKFDGAFLECMIGQTWSIDTWGTFDQMMAKYRSAINGVKPGGIVGFGVCMDDTDPTNPAAKAQFLYALAVVVMDDGYIALSDNQATYRTVPWFPELDFDFGRPVDGPQTAPFDGGILWRRRFENYTVWVDPVNKTGVIEEIATPLPTPENDFNGDGMSDILWRKPSTGENALWHMSGFNRLAGQNLNSATTDWKVAGVADFNADGKADILWRNTNGANSIWLMDGFTRLDAQGIGTTLVEWEVAGVDDFNGDGRADILWRHSVTGANVIYLMDGFTRLAGQNINSAVLDWKVAALGDYNGDGKADILFRKPATGENVIWLMDGFTRLAGQSINSALSVWQVEPNN